MKFRIEDTQQNRDTIIALVCNKSEVGHKSFFGNSRTRKNILSRQICFKIFREYLGLTLKETGAATALKMRHYTTVLEACRRINELLEVKDPDATELWNSISIDLARLFRETKSITIQLNDNAQIEKLIEFLHKNQMTDYDVL